MPIFEYLCKKCQNKFEILSLGKDKSQVICPRCKGKETDKLFSSFGFSSGGNFISSYSSGDCSTCKAKNCDSCS